MVERRLKGEGLGHIAGGFTALAEMLLFLSFVVSYVQHSDMLAKI